MLPLSSRGVWALVVGSLKKNFFCGFPYFCYTKRDLKDIYFFLLTQPLRLYSSSKMQKYIGSAYFIYDLFSINFLSLVRLRWVT